MNKFENANILVVDDNHQNLKVVAELLETENFEVTVASSGQQALEHLKNEKPDLILLDVMMPEMDGFEVCERIKQNLETKHIPVIFLTAKIETDDLVKGFDVGAVDYINKPFVQKELLARVKTHVTLKLTLEENNKLMGIIPICSNCKNIRDDEGYWHKVETFIKQRSLASFSHTVCATCMEKLYPDLMQNESFRNEIK